MVPRKRDCQVQEHLSSSFKNSKFKLPIAILCKLVYTLLQVKYYPLLSLNSQLTGRWEFRNINESTFPNRNNPTCDFRGDPPDLTSRLSSFELRLEERFLAGEGGGENISI